MQQTTLYSHSNKGKGWRSDKATDKKVDHENDPAQEADPRCDPASNAIQEKPVSAIVSADDIYVNLVYLRNWRRSSSLLKITKVDHL